MRRNLHLPTDRLDALSPQQPEHDLDLRLRTPPLRQLRRLLLAHHRHCPHSMDPSEIVQMPVHGNRGLYTSDWLDVRSLQACYQLVDAETLYAVVTEPRKLRKKALANLNNTVHERS